MKNLLVCIDLEMNNEPDLNNKLVVTDIIQIGACILDLKSNTIVDKFNKYVKLPDGKKVHPKIIQLTGITDETLYTEGTSLYLAYKELEFFMSKYDVLRDSVSWGGNDGKYLCSELKNKCSFNENYVFNTNSLIDVKKIYQMYCLKNGIKLKSGLGKSLTKVGLTFIGRQHDALDDAINAGRMLFFLCNNFKQLTK